MFAADFVHVTSYGFPSTELPKKDGSCIWTHWIVREGAEDGIVEPGERVSILRRSCVGLKRGARRLVVTSRRTWLHFRWKIAVTYWIKNLFEIIFH